MKQLYCATEFKWMRGLFHGVINKQSSTTRENEHSQYVGLLKIHNA